MSRLAGLMVSVLVLSVAACSSSGPSGVSFTRTLDGKPMTACTISGEVPVKASVAGFCGTLQVPEDRSNPAGRKIGLNVAVVPANSSSPRSDPFFALAGGPGDASTSFFAWLPGLYAAVHATHDIVLVDQRGTGGSNAMTLPAMPDVSGLSEAGASAKLDAWARDGLAALNGDPRFYTSSVSADDLDAVRASLGYGKIDLYGTSYGGELAQYYLRQHADQVRVAVLDGTTPLDVPVLERMPISSQQALDLLIGRCAQDAACAGAFPKLADEWSALEAAFAKGVTGTDANGNQGTADLTMIGPSIHQALLTGGAAAQLPLAIHLASLGKWDQANQLIPPASPLLAGPTLATYDMILCSEAWARFDPAEVARLGTGSYFTPYAVSWANQMATMCKHLPKGVVPSNDAAVVETKLPVLWLTGDGDPQDGPSNLTGVPAQQPNSKIVVMPAQEHVVGHIGCGPDLIARFIDVGTADGLDTSCVAAALSSAPTFHLP